jgi:hypothetical protein
MKCEQAETSDMLNCWVWLVSGDREYAPCDGMNGCEVLKVPVDRLQTKDPRR